MAKPADAKDLKSFGGQPPCGFKSRPGHHAPREWVAPGKRRWRGRSRAEARENFREGIALYLESLREHGDPLAPSIQEEVIEVAGG